MCILLLAARSMRAVMRVRVRQAAQTLRRHHIGHRQLAAALTQPRLSPLQPTHTTGQRPYQQHCHHSGSCLWRKTSLQRSVWNQINPLKPKASNYYTLPFLISDIRALWCSGLKLKTVG